MSCLVHPDDTAPNKAVQEIIASYKTRFHQEAVLRVKAHTYVSLGILDHGWLRRERWFNKFIARTKRTYKMRSIWQNLLRRTIEKTVTLLDLLRQFLFCREHATKLKMGVLIIGCN